MKIDRRTQAGPDVVDRVAVAAAQDLRSAMRGEVVLRGDDAYAETRQVWVGAVEAQPALFALCEAVEDVQSAVRIARKHDLPLSVRGGGHDVVGRSLRHDGLVIDLGRMKKVDVDAGARIADLEGGATAGDLIDAAAANDLLAVTGTASTVGMAGLTIGGGYGPLTPRYGLALDCLLGADVVLADGQLVRADASRNADLFWALRGGGGNFGVVTSLRVRLHAAEGLLSGTILFPWSQAESVLRGYAESMMSAPDELGVTAGVAFGPDGGPAVFLAPTWVGDPAQGEAFIARLSGLGTPLRSTVGPTSCGAMLRSGDAQFGRTRHAPQQVQTRWQAEVTPETISAIIAAGDNSPSPLSVITLQSFHGAAARVKLESTAFGLRQRHFLVLIVAAWEPGAELRGRTPGEWAQSLSRALAPDSLPGGYANLLGPDDHEQIASAYGSNAERLRAIKRELDPDGVFTSAIPLPATP